MQKKKSFRHTHSIVVPPPLRIEEIVFNCRSWMRETYACKSGHGTPPHITLIAPFALSSEFNDGDVFSAAERALTECVANGVMPFAARASGFGAFSERTLFIHIEDSENWQKAYSIFAKVFFEQILFETKKSGRKFYPHLTIANRDIPTGVMDGALKHFGQMNLREEFFADAICIYTRTEHGQWREARRLIANCN